MKIKRLSTVWAQEPHSDSGAVAIQKTKTDIIMD